LNRLVQSRAFAGAIGGIGLLVAGVMALAQPRTAQATLVVQEGEVTLHQHKPVFLFVVSRSQQTLSAGEAITVGPDDRVIAGAGSQAQLRFLDGSTLDLLAGAEVALDQLDTDDAGPYRVEVSLLAGRIANQVRRVLGTGDRYQVITPSSTAGVRGTEFVAEVLGSQESYFACNEGAVVVTMQEQQVELLPGEEVTARAGQPLQIRAQAPPPPPLNLDDIQDRSQIVIQSSAQPGDVIDIFLNGEIVMTVTADENGNFTFTADAEAEGVYVYTVRVTNARGFTSEEAVLVEIVTDFTPPALELLSPSMPPRSGQTVLVSGRTEPGASVTVDGQAVTVGADGYFETQVTAGSGPIAIEAVDPSGNTTSLEIGLE
jgi:mannose-6-phosphate isomerase-like protein (cupin superfamily)